jgi:hypothetical protein
MNRSLERGPIEPGTPLIDGFVAEANCVCAFFSNVGVFDALIRHGGRPTEIAVSGFRLGSWGSSWSEKCVEVITLQRSDAIVTV